MRFRLGTRCCNRCLVRLCRWGRWPLLGMLLWVVFYLLVWHRKTFIRDLDYWVRPLWGKPARVGPQKTIPHFYAERVPAQNRCTWHGWSPRIGKVQLFDAFTMSVELDILEIRLRELWSVVDIFVIVEADRTFMGREKPLYFQENRERFAWADEKIRHFVVHSLSSNPTVLFENESNMRSKITGFIQSLSPSPGDLIVASDIDEIPSAKALELVKSCTGYPKELHLLVDEYLYSFEFPLQTTNWRPHVTIYEPYNYWFHHIIMPETREMLADAGWHCTFCFRYLADFIFKMTSYSHSDLITETDYVNEDALQRRVCEGRDIYEMPPEAYSIRDFVARSGPLKKKQSTIGIPEWVIQDREKFQFLLPGGCVREDYRNSSSTTPK